MSEEMFLRNASYEQRSAPQNFVSSASRKSMLMKNADKLQKSQQSYRPGQISSEGSLIAQAQALPPHNMIRTKRPVGYSKKSPSSRAFWVGLGVSIGWAVSVIGIITQSGDVSSFAGVPLASWAIGISTIVSPLALIWMVAAYMQRASDIQAITDPLKRQLTMITGESGAAHARINRFNEAVREQIALLKNAQTMSRDEFESIIRRIQEYREEFGKFEDMGSQQLQEIQEVVHRSMYQIEKMMDDKFSMLRVIDGRLTQNSENVADRVAIVGEQVSKMLDGVERASAKIADTFDRVQTDNERLVDMYKLQESSLSNAAACAADTLGGLSERIDMNVARFLEKASNAREEADRIANAIDAQTRSLDDLSTGLPSRIVESESLLRDVVDKLSSVEKSTCEQVQHLDQALSFRVAGVSDLVEKFAGVVDGFDTRFEDKKSIIDTFKSRVDSVSTGFFGAWERSIEDLHGKMKDAVLRFSVINDETANNTKSLIGHLEEATGRYDTVTARMQQINNESGDRIKNLTEGLSSHMAEYERLSKVSAKAGEEAQVRVVEGLANIQKILDKVLSVKDVAKQVGHDMVAEMTSAIVQSEKMMTKLVEATHVSTKAIGAATDTFGRHESELVGKARASEAILKEAVQKLQSNMDSAGKSLREQTVGLMDILTQTQSQVNATNQKLQTFATQAVVPVQKAIEKIEASSTQGLKVISGFSEGMEKQSGSLEEFYKKVSSISQEMSKDSAVSTEYLEKLGQRFAEIQSKQEEAVRNIAGQFNSMAQTLKVESEGLGGNAAKVIDLLSAAVGSIGSQSQQMMEKARTSSENVKSVVSVLKEETLNIEKLLEGSSKQVAEHISTAERKFAAINDVISQKVTVFDSRINETVNTCEGAVQKIGASDTKMRQTLEGMRAMFSQEVAQIGASVEGISIHSKDLVRSSRDAMEGLSSLKGEMQNVRESIVSQSSEVISNVENITNVLKDSADAVSYAGESVVSSVASASDLMGRRSGDLSDSGDKMASVLKDLMSTTEALVDRTSKICTDIENKSSELMSRLSESSTRLGMAGGDIKSVIDAASDRVDGFSVKFAETSSAAASSLGSAVDSLSDMSHKANASLLDLGADVARQSASLFVVGEQIVEQQKLLAESSEQQRTKMLNLFERIQEAYLKASEMAQKAIDSVSGSLNDVVGSLEAVEGRSKNAVGSVKAASIGFSEQSSFLMQSAVAAEEKARAILEVTTSLHEQACRLHDGMRDESSRAKESIESLLLRLSEGNTEMKMLRDSSSDMFATLQNLFDAKVSGVAESMEKMNVRQQALTSALNSQQQEIEGIINKFARLQEEGVTTISTTTDKLNYGVKGVTTALADMSAQASVTLSSVQSAAEGFVREAEVIKTQSVITEQQIQGMSQVAEQLHYKTQNINSGIRDEAAAVNNMIAEISARLSVAQSSVKDHSLEVSRVLNETTDKIAMVAVEGASTITVQTQAMNNAVMGVNSSISNLGDKVSSQVEAVMNVNDRVEDRVNKFTAITQEAVDKLSSLKTVIESVDSAGGTAAMNAEARIGGVNSSMQQHVDNLNSVSSSVVDKLSSVTEKLANETEVLRSKVTASEQSLSNIVSSVSTDIAQIPAVIDGAVSKISAAQDSLKQQSAAVSSAVAETADKFSASSEKITSDMSSGAKNVTNVTAEATKTLDGFNQILVEQVASMRQNAALLSGEQKDLVEKTSSGVTVLCEASKRLFDLRSEASSMAEKLSSDLDVLDKKANVTGDSIAKIGDSIIQQMASIGEVGIMAQTRLKETESALYEQSSAISARMKTQIDEVNTFLATAVKQMESASTNIRTSATEAVSGIEKASQRFGVVESSTTAQMTSGANKMSKEVLEVVNVLEGFGKRFELMVDSISNSSRQVVSHESGVIERLQQMLSHLSVVAEKLEATKSISGEAAQAAIDRLNEVVIVVQDQMIKLTTSSQSAVDALQGVGEICSKQTDRLSRGVSSARDQVVDMAKNFDDIQKRSDHIRMALKVQGEELMNSLGGIMSSLEATGDGASIVIDRNLQQQAGSGLKN